MDGPRRARREIDVLTQDDVRGLLAACSRRSPTGVRNRALIALLYGSGLRIAEALALRPKDLDLQRLAVTVHSGKRGKRRVSAIFPDAAEVVQRWLDWRKDLGIDGGAPVFCTIKHERAGSWVTAPGHALSREYVAACLRRLGKRISLGKRIFPHLFRHSHAALLRERGFDIEEIRKQLGHANLEVTSVYLDHLGAHHLGERVRDIGPVLEPARAPREELGDLLSRLGDHDVAQLVTLLKKAVV
jgi:site-specific recombinase XerD